ncbi:MAG TPA: xanthine dehydrogenase family protein subunit M [Rubrobacteraceae bacterium]|nr:xanthine dehydrogenase family protein subunit M [Rubrobacteraceae bacterium]
MKPPNFKYYAARSDEQALGLLAEHGDGARVIAGGQSLVQDMNARRVAPRVLIDVNSIGELDFVRPEDGTFVIGALTRTATVERDGDVTGRLPVLAEAAARVGHVAVRNRGTVGGNVAHADPAGNLAPVALALDAVLVARGPDGGRDIAVADFFVGPHRTSLDPTELLTEVRLPAPPPGAGSTFLEISRRGRGWGLAGVAAVVALGDDGTVSEARLALSGVGPTAVRARDAEAAVRGERASEETWRAAAEAAAAALEDPPSDIHASADFRRHLAGVLVRRALGVAAARAEGRS